jgi:hypothetical protein
MMIRGVIAGIKPDKTVMLILLYNPVVNTTRTLNKYKKKIMSIPDPNRVNNGVFL